jgi:hypothetical protein
VPARVSAARRGFPEETGDNYYAAGGAVIIGEGICCQILAVCSFFDIEERTGGRKIGQLG